MASRLLPFALLLVSTPVLAQSALAEPPALTPPGGAEQPSVPAVTVQAPKPEVGYVAGGVLLGNDHFMNGALLVEGGLKLGTAPLWIHGMAATGSAVDVEGGGDFSRLQGGLEVRTSGTGANLFAGFDVGHESQTWSNADGDPTEQHDGTVIGGRVGLDVGGEKTRFRIAADVYRYNHAFTNSTYDDSRRWIGGAELVLELAYRL